MTKVFRKVAQMQTVRTVWPSVVWTLPHCCRTVWTFRTHLDGAEMSWVQSVSGPKCLYTQIVHNKRLIIFKVPTET